MTDLEISPRDVKQCLDSCHQFLLVDVREPWEHDLCRIDGARLVPLGTLPSNLALFEQADDIVVYCHHGRRSLDAVAWLRAQGVDGAHSLAGGIERWSTEIDPAVPRY